MVIFKSYVKLPEGTQKTCEKNEQTNNISELHVLGEKAGGSPEVHICLVVDLPL